jgi:transcriptional regulator with XRE-family HTH domain
MRSDGAKLALGQVLRYLRKADGMAQAEAARQIGVSATHLNNVEKGRDAANAKIVAFYEARFDGDGKAWGLYQDMKTAQRPPQRQSPDDRPSYPILGDASEFVADITIPDDTVMPPYHEFVKTWRIRNSGTVPWTGRWLARRGSPTGHGVPTSPRRVRISDTMPGEEVDITVSMKAQPLEGASQAHFKMVDDDGWEYFPDRYSLGLVLSIIVSDSSPRRNTPARDRPI